MVILWLCYGYRVVILAGVRAGALKRLGNPHTRPSRPRPLVLRTRAGHVGKRPVVSRRRNQHQLVEGLGLSAM